VLGSLRRYDVQGQWAFALTMIALAPCAVALWLGLRNFDATMGRIIYGSQGRFLPAFVACVLLSLGPAGVAFVLGLNSAGQRRNIHSQRSWLAFFVGGAIFTLDLILLIAFYMLRLERPV